MPNRSTDWNSVTDPMEQSMGMVAQHMMRAPQLRYRLDQERRKIDNDTMVSQAQAGNYDAQTAGHQETTRGKKQKNDAAMRLLENKEAIDSVFGQTTPLTPEQNALRQQAITDLMIFKGTSATDSVTMLQRAAQGKMVAAGVPTEDIARATGSITSIRNKDADIAARVPTVAPGAMYRINGEWKTNPSAAAQANDSYETTTQKFKEQAIPADVTTIPAVPASGNWNPFKANTPAVAERYVTNRPAMTIPERTVTTRRQIGDFNQITEPAAATTPAAPQATQDFVQPQDPDDSDMSGREVDPQSRMDSLIREAQNAIRAGADPAAVMKRAKEKYGVTLTIK